MAKCSVFVGTSVDGFIARRDGRFDFLPPDGGEEHGYKAFIATVDAIVMGRGTFDVVVGLGHWPFRQPVFVLTTRPYMPTLPPGARIEFMSGEPTEIVARLSARGYRHLYVDGGLTIQRFLGAGLVHTMTITRAPVVIGEGIPLFGPTHRDVRLEHLETRSYPSGLVTTEYALAGSPPSEGAVIPPTPRR
ncbi:MAG TPA: dihydrofolate reductase family protein [Gemmatimonadaceae bacterium]|jgi:dihydrofolate reductase